MPVDSATFLVLSDIHFGKFAISNDFAVPSNPLKYEMRGAIPMKDALIATVKKQASKVSGVLVPGDLTSVAAPGEFQGSIQTVFEIAGALAVEKENVFFTFGNHDVDWRIAALADADDKDPLYNVLAARSGSIFAGTQPTQPGPVPGSGVFVRNSYTILAVNSGYYCYKSQEYPHGKLGPEQLAWLKDVLSKYRSDGLRMVMAHHHPFKYPFATVVPDISCIEEGAELVELIGRAGIHVFCHGHRHEPKIFTEMRTGWDRPITFVCAGSVAVNEHHRNRGEIPNLFHLLSVEKELRSGACFGRVMSFRYRSATGWDPTEYGPSTPLDPVHRFGVPGDAKMRRDAAEAIIKAAAVEAAAANKSALLPDIASLPDGLQCTISHELNELLNGVARSLGYKLFGKYPDPVLIQL